jgi:hypothetical protein
MGAATPSHIRNRIPTAMMRQRGFMTIFVEHVRVEEEEEKGELFKEAGQRATFGTGIRDTASR